MLLRDKLAALVIAVLLFGCCGGGGAPKPTALHVQTFPSDGVGRVNEAPPWNQVSFTAYLRYDDGSLGTDPLAGVQWTTDPQNYWVALNGNVATCFQSSLSRAVVQASAQVNGVTITGQGTMWCIWGF